MIGRDKIRWGILGTGRRAGQFAQALRETTRGALVAVGSRSRETADLFGATFGIPRRHGSYEALLDDPDVDALYIATPHAAHAQWAIRGAEAGKHLLVERPLALNSAEGMAIVEAARQNDVFLMEGGAFRYHPQVERLTDLLAQRAVGEITLIRAACGFRAAVPPGNRLFDNRLGGGSILELGGDLVALACRAAAAALRTETAEPLDLFGAGHVGTTRVDESAAALLRFPGGLCAQLACSIRDDLENEAVFDGTEGRLVLAAPGANGAGERLLLLYAAGQTEPRQFRFPSARSPLAAEAEAVADFLQAHQCPARTWEESLITLRALDRWRQAVGVEFAPETPEGLTRPVHGRPLAVRKAAYMPRRRLAGSDLEISQLILGTLHLHEAPLAFSLFDDFFERGGNTFDTAYVYGQGRAEQRLGQWMAQRQVRNQVHLIVKGGHTPYCTPEWLTRQLVESLDRLQTGRVDLYLLHRDNIEVPVGAFIETLNEHQRAGRIGLFGVSNWNLTRVEAGNAYAREHGLNGFVAVSNQFSLARLVEPPWPGVVSASDPKSRAWILRSGLPLLPWSSQAGGFFAIPNPASHVSRDLLRCWSSDDNFQRLERAKQLATRRGVAPIQIALAYVLNQPFPCFPIIGPLRLAELRASCEAVLIRLSPGELAWLNLETDAP